MSHIPVLLNETLAVLSPKNEDRIIDATFGGGGHTSAILDICKNCSVFGIDRDPDAMLRAQSIKNKYQERFNFFPGQFSNISEILKDHGKFDGILFDFGISSFQVDEADRGFSFSKSGNLDMRMSKDGLSAYDVVNSFDEEDLANIIWTYGDEPKSRRIASIIVESRKNSKIETTSELRNIVSKAFGFQSINKQYSKVDVATKTFQAIRIFVNDELSEIDKALKQLPEILNDGARVAAISFHSLEDRIVKTWSKSNKKFFSPINKAVIKATKEEILKNPRSRSAVLRGFVYTKDGGEKI